MNRRALLRGLLAIPVVALLPRPFVCRILGDCRTYDDWLRNVWGPVLREHLGPLARFVEQDGVILKWSEHANAYRASVVAPNVGVAGMIQVSRALIQGSRGDEHAFVRALSAEMSALIREMERAVT